MQGSSDACGSRAFLWVKVKGGHSTENCGASAWQHNRHFTIEFRVVNDWAPRYFLPFTFKFMLGRGVRSWPLWKGVEVTQLTSSLFSHNKATFCGVCCQRSSEEHRYPLAPTLSKCPVLLNHISQLIKRHFQGFGHDGRFQIAAAGFIWIWKAAWENSETQAPHMSNGEMRSCSQVSRRVPKAWSKVSL